MCIRIDVRLRVCIILHIHTRINDIHVLTCHTAVARTSLLLLRILPLFSSRIFQERSFCSSRRRQSVFVKVYVCMCVCVCVCTYVCMYACTFVGRQLCCNELDAGVDLVCSSNRRPSTCVIVYVCVCLYVHTYVITS